MTGLDALFSAEVVASLEQLIDERVEQRLAELEMATPAPSKYMTVVEAAEFLRSSRQRVDDLLSSRRLRRYKDGGRTLVSREELERYVAGNGR